MKKIFIFLVKYIPVIQMAGIIFNNLLCTLTDSLYPEIIDFVLGNSVVATFLLFVCSYLFGFCKWHRLVITANLINIFIATIDCVYSLNTTNFLQLLIFFTIDLIFIILIIIHKFKCKS